MAERTMSIDYWRKLFRSASSDIFEVIEKAIVVAALDCPDEFAGKRDRIAETLYTCRIARCGGCDRAELQPGEEFREDDCSNREEVEEDEEKGKTNSSCDGLRGSYEIKEINRVGSSCSYDEAQALTDEIEEKSQTVDEVMRIKEILVNQEDESDKVLFESLRRLQLMELTVEILKATEIGKAVNGLKRHISKQIRHLVRTLIEGWKILVDEWVKATAAIADTPPDSINPSVVSEDDWLPFPPLDEGALLATQTASYEFSKFFDGMDEDGNPRNVETEKKTERKPQLEKSNPVRKQQVPRQETVTRSPRPQGDLTRQNKPPPATDLGPGRPTKPAIEQKFSAGTAKPHNRQEQAAITKKPSTALLESDESSVRARLEIAKRKLHEGYRQAENAKKQRTIQMMELQDIPRQAHTQRQSNAKPRNNIRSLLSGRR